MSQRRVLRILTQAAGSASCTVRPRGCELAGTAGNSCLRKALL